MGRLRERLSTARRALSTLVELDDRNLTAHTYNEALALMIYARLPAIPTGP